jgi:hypothetical protein
VTTDAGRRRAAGQGPSTRLPPCGTIWSHTTRRHFQARGVPRGTAAGCPAAPRNHSWPHAAWSKALAGALAGCVRAPFVSKTLAGSCPARNPQPRSPTETDASWPGRPKPPGSLHVEGMPGRGHGRVYRLGSAHSPHGSAEGQHRAPGSHVRVRHLARRVALSGARIVGTNRPNMSTPSVKYTLHRIACWTFWHICARLDG